eukprot:TRINITY_DN6715_c0_g5_i1.p1 TRINITY_DN6715_c0_g5~~TRINITY_DN6715_c0_g5_i1.p1  ORF type:complete len:110 (+),score=20.53 TRINITY_DN6715_c0_g5_i1:89-418(+)
MSYQMSGYSVNMKNQCTGHLKLGCKESLKELLRPSMQAAVEPWMQQATEKEMRGIVRMMRLAAPDKLDIDKPRPAQNVPTCCTKKGLKSPLAKSGSFTMLKSMSSPALR